MIQQPILQPIQQPICDSASQRSGNSVEHSWLGHGVAVAKAFAQSLIPMEDPCFSINPNKTLEDIGRLATAIILPTSPIFFVVKDIADAWFGSCVPGPDVKPELPQTSKATGEEAQEKEPGSKDVPLQQPSTARHQGSQGTRGLLALGTLASSFHYANSDAIADGSQPIRINDTETLGKIGHDPEFPLSGRYQQTKNIAVTPAYQSIGNVTHPFTGEYDGQCHTIKGLPDCFVDTLKQGSIRHLRFTDANINSTELTGLAACVVDINGTVIGVRAENVRISTWGDNVYAGIGGGVVRGTVANITAVNSTVETLGKSACAGIGGALIDDGGAVANTAAVDSTVKTRGKNAHAGIGGGLVDNGGTVACTTAVNSTVETSGDVAYAGIGGGLVYHGGAVANTTAMNSTVETSGDVAFAGIGGGVVDTGTVVNTTAVDSTVKTSGKYAHAGIGGGFVYNGGTVVNTTVMNSTVKTSGENARAGFEAGRVFYGGMVGNPTVVNSRIAATASTAATVGIIIGSLLRAGGLGIAGYSTYQWITGYREGLRGQELAMKPLTCGKELAGAAVNSVRGLAEALRHPLTVRQAQQQSAAVAELPTESRATTQAIEIAAPNTTVHDSVYEDVSHLTAKSSPTAPVHGNTYENVSLQSSKSQGIQGTRKRMNRQRVPTHQPME